MRQRVMIAMALACGPEVLIADELTTALDVTVQAEILDLVRALQRERGTAVLMITHDMGVVAEMAGRDVVLREGRAVEAAPVRAHGLARGSEIEARVARLSRRVGPAADILRRYPHEFSGGQRQRVCIARALALSPKLIVAVDCISALDVSVEAQVLDLLQELQDEDGLADPFISHDRAVIDRVADRAMVMRMGQVIEEGPRDAVLRDARHPYTRRLLTAVPMPDPTRRRPPRPTPDHADAGSPALPAGRSPESAVLREVDPAHHVAA